MIGEQYLCMWLSRFLWSVKDWKPGLKLPANFLWFFRFRERASEFCSWAKAYLFKFLLYSRKMRLERAKGKVTPNRTSMEYFFYFSFF